jgi:hypothetical protein
VNDVKGRDKPRDKPGHDGQGRGAAPTVSFKGLEGGRRGTRKDGRRPMGASLDPDHSSAMNMPSTKLQRKRAPTAERARTQVTRAAECGAAAFGLRLKGGGSHKKFGKTSFRFLRLATP